MPFRVVLALAILATHLALMAKLGHERLGYDFDRSPDNPPGFADPRGDIQRWDRLLVSHWDAQHYMAIASRGYKYCKAKGTLGPGEHFDDGGACMLHFYPTYGLLGRGVAEVTHWPIDYSLLAVSLAASFAFLLMWTSEAITSALGVGGAYLSLLLLNVFSSGYVLVTLQTEPCLMAFTLASFVCFRKRWLVAGALAAGAASAIRISGVGVSAAFSAGLLAMTLSSDPRPNLVWLRRAALVALSGWGLLALMAYYTYRFGDPFIYAHSYTQGSTQSMGLLKAFIPDGRVVLESIWAEPNDGVYLAAGLLWFALGHRRGLGRFAPDQRVFWYVLYFAIMGLTLVGTVNNAFGGAARYLLPLPPLFFAMAAVLRRHPAALLLWVFMSSTHYYNAGVCVYESERHPDRLHRCGFARYFRTDDLRAGRPLP